MAQTPPRRRTSSTGDRTTAAAAAAVSAGAQRASGERAVRQRRTTPLLAERLPMVNGTEANGAPVNGTEVNRAGANGTEVTAAVAPTGPARNGTARNAAAKDAAAKDGTAKKSTARNGTAKDAATKRTATKKATAGNGTAGNGSAGNGPAEDVAPTDAPRTPDRPTPIRAVRGGPSGAGRPRVRVRAASAASGSGRAATTGDGSPRSGPGPSGSGGPGPSVARRERLVAVTSVAERVGEELADTLLGGARAGVLEEQLAGLLEWLRRRLVGDYQVDEFGFDPELTDKVLFALLRPVYRRWFRVEVSGIENIPVTGGALVVANHSGAIALDSLMTCVAVHDEHPAHRFLRPLGADLVFQTPFVGEIARKSGATLAANADAERLLTSGELVGVWPEGFKGIGKPFSERYKLQRFGRGGFVSAALRTRTPIVPCSIVGAEETYPIIGNLPAVARLLGLPYVPVTPTWPWLGPLGMIPLPSKWLIEFGPPVATDELGLGAADDPMLVFDLTDQIRQTIQQTLYALLIQRRSVFF